MKAGKLFMYSDIWLRDGSVHKAPPIAITKEICLVRWLNEGNELIGIGLNLEYAEDIHYEFLADDWDLFICSVLKQDPASDYIPSLKRYFQSPSSHMDSDLWNNGIEFKKISYWE